MKIAFLTPEYPHNKTGKSGGIGTSIKTLASALVELGHEVRILVYGQHEDATFRDENILIQQIKNIKFKGLSWYLTRKKIEKIINYLHQNNQIDIVEAPDWTGITSFIKPQKCPVVIKLHGSDTYFCHLDKRPVKRWNQFHELKALKNATACISVSQYTARKTNEIFDLNLNFEIIHNGIDLNVFKPLLVNNEKLILLYFGTLIRKKGVLELPLIFNLINEKNHNIELHLIGKDAPDIISKNISTWEMMQKLFTSKAIEKVKYHGVIPYELMKEKIASATICIFPTFAEALPVSWLEAMAMKKAIVASNIGWGEEIIKNGENGILIHPKDHQKYADSILKLISDKELKIKMEENAFLSIVSAFDNSIIAKQNIAFYQKILNK